MGTIKPTFLMCPPDYFEYSEYRAPINSHMKRMFGVDRIKARAQYETLKQTLISRGAEVIELTPIKGLPDMVFVRNAGLLLPSFNSGGQKVILSSFKDKERNPERLHYLQWFLENGYTMLLFETGKKRVFEGNGEAMFWHDRLCIGYDSIRMTSDDVKHLTFLLYGQKLGHLEIVLLKLTTKDFYHLDTCFMPILRPLGYSDILVYYPQAFDDISLASIEKLPAVSRVPVSGEDAHAFGCNLISFGNHVIMPTGTKNLADTLRNHDLDVCEIDVHEFIQCGGGGPFCMTFELPAHVQTEVGE